jgi:arsenical-resistance protein 2
MSLTLATFCKNRRSASTTLTLVGSSRGRGTRAAGWFNDLIKEKGHQSMKSLVLLEGITGWAAAGKEYIDMIDGYEKETWEEKSLKKSRVQQ